jgi:translation initiation factor 3 subunit F
MSPVTSSLLAAGLSVRVQPVVLFSICDAFTRRKEQQERVIGTLLGTVADNVIEVKNCYVVPHSESMEQVAVDVAHHKTMFELHQKVAPAEVIVGWCAAARDRCGRPDPPLQDAPSPS